MESKGGTKGGSIAKLFRRPPLMPPPENLPPRKRQKSSGSSQKHSSSFSSSSSSRPQSTFIHSTINTDNAAAAENGDQDETMWIDKHGPRSVAQLEVCVHNGTVKRVRDWLELASRELSRSRSSRKHEHQSFSHGSNSAVRKRLLILCGKPGTGKSTTVRILASEMGIDLREWADNYGQVSGMGYSQRDEEILLPDEMRDRAMVDDPTRLPYSSHLDQFSRFLHSGRFKSLDGENSLNRLTTNTIESQSSRSIPLPAHSLFQDSSAKRFKRNHNSVKSSTISSKNGCCFSDRRPVLLLESLPSTSFVRSSASNSGPGFASSSAIRESPLEQLRSCLTAFVGNMRAAPAVLIFSDVAEKNESASAIDRLLGKDLAQSILVECIEFNPITERKITKRLREILRSENNINNGHHNSHSFNTYHERVSMSDAELNQVSLQASGDLRSAINSLQLRARGVTQRKATGKKNYILSDSYGSGGSDTRFSSLHVIGKLLHGKKKGSQGSSSAVAARGINNSNTSGDSKMHFKTIPPLPMTSSSLSRAFSGSGSARKPKNDTETNEIWKPETLIGQCEMSVDAVTSFIQHNCVEFFSEIGDLAVGLRTLSDADLFIGRIFSTSHSRDHGDAIFPTRYVESLSSRAVATSNSRPDERRTRAFKPISRPRLYEGAKQRVANLAGLRHQLRLMSALDSHMHPGAVNDMLPYLKYFEGGVPGSQPSSAFDLKNPDGPDAAAKATAVTKAVLAADDIGEF